MNEEEILSKKIILFDGVCILCNESVQFVLKHERAPDFHFASIQSETGAFLLKWCGLPADFLEAVIYIENGTVHVGSTAALRIGKQLFPPWSFFAWFGLFVPKFIRDKVYLFISRNRYHWFGRKDTCMVPSVEIKARFL